MLTACDETTCEHNLNVNKLPNLKKLWKTVAFDAPRRPDVPPILSMILFYDRIHCRLLLSPKACYQADIVDSQASGDNNISGNLKKKNIFQIFIWSL